MTFSTATLFRDVLAKLAVAAGICSTRFMQAIQLLLSRPYEAKGCI